MFNDALKSPGASLEEDPGISKLVSSEFHEAESGILFTSDVSARGIDYPGVTHVVQFGMPLSRDQYEGPMEKVGSCSVHSSMHSSRSCEAN